MNTEHPIIAHVDMDAFFAAVEQRDHPELKGKPVIIGADPKHGKGRGVVATCSYEARAYGVHSAQPISAAYQRCPHAVYLPGSMSRYREVSLQIRQIFYDFTPDVEPISIDEAFLDLTGCCHFYGSPLQTAQAIKQTIKDKIGLTASIGIAPVKMLAKIASDFDKPDGLTIIKPEHVASFLKPLPVEKLWGVGPKAKAVLNKHGIKTVGDLACRSREQLGQWFGRHGDHLYCMAHGIDLRRVEVTEEIKSVSHEHTFETDVRDKDVVLRSILILSEKVSRRLRKAELKGKTISIKIRLKGFKTYTRACTISIRTNLIDDIYTAAKKMFEEFYKPAHQIRLIGVRVAQLDDPYLQDDLYANETARKLENVHKAMDLIKDRFGESSIKRGI